MARLNENKAVGMLSELLALKWGYSPMKARNIRYAAVLHDAGKREIPADILNKPGKLNDHEMEIMKTHTKLGAKLLSGLKGELGDMVKMVCTFHHEKLDGSGYWGVPS